MEYQNAVNIPFDFIKINEIAYATHYLFGRYIDNYSSPRPLSPSWIKRKQNDSFWKGLGANVVNGAFTEFQITPREAPDGAYYIGWFSFDVPPHFKIAADRYEDRRLLPDGASSFSESGEPTAEFCDFMTHLAYQAASELGYLA